MFIVYFEIFGTTPGETRIGYTLSWRYLQRLNILLFYCLRLTFRSQK
jgi:hypothetical protein